MKSFKFFYSIFLVSFLALNCQTAYSQDKLSTEGIVGDVDEGRRAPVLTYSTEIAADLSNAKILVDTQIINEEFRKYPIAVDFFVNGKLFSRQFRSIELPAPLGIDVPTELAAIPFNYAIVATLLHPNRQYVTIAQGAITEAQASKKLACTLDRSSDALSIEGEVTNTLDDANKLSVSFGTGTTAALDLEFEATASTTTTEVSGSVKITDEEGTETTVEVTGTAEVSGKTVSSLEVDSEDADINVLCETATITAETSSEQTALEANAANSELGNFESAISSQEEPVPATETDSKYGPNFIPLDRVGEVEVVN